MRPPWNSKTKSQRSEPKWLLKCLITPKFCVKFQLNRLTTSFGSLSTFSNNDTYVNLNKTQLINTFYNNKNFFVIAIHNSPLVFPQDSSYQPRVYQLSLSRVHSTTEKTHSQVTTDPLTRICEIWELLHTSFSLKVFIFYIITKTVRFNYIQFLRR